MSQGVLDEGKIKIEYRSRSLEASIYALVFI